MNSLDHPILFLEKLASGLGLDLSPDFYIDLQKWLTPVSSHFTIGIEIEILWSSYFPELKEKWFGKTNGPQIRGGYEGFTELQKTLFSKECEKEEAEIRQKLEITQSLGIPRWEDAYWEFAIPPFRHVEYLIGLLDILYLAGLLPHDRAHSLHITIGGLRPSFESGLFLSYLERISGVSWDRILRGFHPLDDRYNAGWARRGVAGMRERPRDELLGETLVATEFRTLVLPTGWEERKEFFREVGRIGSICVTPPDLRSPEERISWGEISRETTQYTESYGLSPDRTLWGNPNTEPGVWRRWGGKFIY